MQKVEIDYTMRGHILSDDIEDVDYIDISTDQKIDQKNKQSYDISARAKQVAEAASEFIERNCKDGEPILQVFVMSSFSHAASWTDKNPLSSFSSDSNQHNALRAYLKRENDNIYKESGKKIDPIFALLELATSESARRWANNNPPKYY